MDKDSIITVKNGLLMIQQFIPFILVWYFIIYSLMNYTMSGIIVIIGMIFASFTTMLIGKSILHSPDFSLSSQKCNFISIRHISGISNIPFSQTIYGFTFSYMLYTALLYNQIFTYVFPLLCFFVLLVSDIIWLNQNSCFPTNNILFSTIVSSVIGVFWGYTIKNIPNKSMQYVASPYETCTLPTKRSYKCSPKSKI